MDAYRAHQDTSVTAQEYQTFLNTRALLPISVAKDVCRLLHAQEVTIYLNHTLADQAQTACYAQKAGIAQ